MHQQILSGFSSIECYALVVTLSPYQKFMLQSEWKMSMDF